MAVVLLFASWSVVPFRSLALRSASTTLATILEVRTSTRVSSTSNSHSPRSPYDATTLVASFTLMFISSPMVFLFASLSVNLLNIFNNLSKARQALTT